MQRSGLPVQREVPEHGWQAFCVCNGFIPHYELHMLTGMARFTMYFDLM